MQNTFYFISIDKKLKNIEGIMSFSMKNNDFVHILKNTYAVTPED